MAWTHVKNNYGMGLEAQWIFRAQNAPVCSLKRDGSAWKASLLNLSGISSTIMYLPILTLEQAQDDCERELIRMGWRWGTYTTTSEAKHA